MKHEPRASVRTHRLLRLALLGALVLLLGPVAACGGSTGRTRAAPPRELEPFRTGEVAGSGGRGTHAPALSTREAHIHGDACPANLATAMDWSVYVTAPR